MAKMVRVRNRLVGMDEVLIEVLKWWKWGESPKQSASETFGSYSAARNRLEKKIADASDKIDDLLYELNDLEEDLITEVKDCLKYAVHTNGYSEWYDIDQKELKKLEGSFSRIDQDWRDKFNAKHLRSFGLRTRQQMEKELDSFTGHAHFGKQQQNSSLPFGIPNMVSEEGDGTVYHMKGVHGTQVDDLAASMGASDSREFQPPKKDKNKQGKKNKQKNKQHNQHHSRDDDND